METRRRRDVLIEDDERERGPPPSALRGAIDEKGLRRVNCGHVGDGYDSQASVVSEGRLAGETNHGG